MSALRSVKVLAVFVLLVGGATISFLTFALNFSITFTLFRRLTPQEEFLGVIVLLGPLPLVAGAALLFFRRTQKLGAVSTLVGGAVMTAYLVILYVRAVMSPSGALEWILAYLVIPLAVIAVDAAALRVYKLTKSLSAAKAAAPAG